MPDGFEFPKGKGLLIDTDIGITHPADIAKMLDDVKDDPVLNDLDKDTILRIASALQGIETLIDKAGAALNMIAVAKGDNTRVAFSAPFIATAITTPTITKAPEDEDAD